VSVDLIATAIEASQSLDDAFSFDPGFADVRANDATVQEVTEQSIVRGKVAVGGVEQHRVLNVLAVLSAVEITLDTARHRRVASLSLGVSARNEPDGHGCERIASRVVWAPAHGHEPGALPLA
jgi:hypothetical protein